MITFGMEIRMKFQFRYVAGASNAIYLDQFPSRRQRVAALTSARFRPLMAAYVHTSTLGRIGRRGQWPMSLSTLPIQSGPALAVG
jgi:hypothetical protein